MKALNYLTFAVAFLLISIFRPSAYAGEVDWGNINKVADQILAKTPSNLDELTVLIEASGYGETDRAALIYSTIAKSVYYDVELMMSASNERMEPETVWQRKKGICSNYVDLYRELATRTKLTTFSVVGYSKQRDLQEVSKTPDHEWLILQADSRFLLVDPTWGSGYLNEENIFVRSFETKWFDSKPELFAQTHYPVAPMFQLVDCPVPFSAFKMDVEQTIRHFERPGRCPKWSDTLSKYLAEPHELKALYVGKQAYVHSGDRQLYAMALLDHVMISENNAQVIKKKALNDRVAAEGYRKVLIDQRQKVTQAIGLLKAIGSPQAKQALGIATNNLQNIERNLKVINLLLVPK